MIIYSTVDITLFTVEYINKVTHTPSATKIKEQQAQIIKAALAPLLDKGGDFQDIVRHLTQIVSYLTIPEPGTTHPFIMLHPRQFIAVADWIIANSKRPTKTLYLWIVLQGSFKKHTGEINLTRDQIAERINVTGSNASQIMKDLLSCQAIFAKREKIPGLRGPGKVVYYMNKHVAETGSRATKEELDKIPKPGGLEND